MPLRCRSVLTSAVLNTIKVYPLLEASSYRHQNDLETTSFGPLRVIWVNWLFDPGVSRTFVFWNDQDIFSSTVHNGVMTPSEAFVQRFFPDRQER